MLVLFSWGLFAFCIFKSLLFIHVGFFERRDLIRGRLCGVIGINAQLKEIFEFSSSNNLNLMYLMLLGRGSEHPTVSIQLVVERGGRYCYYVILQ